MHSVNRPEIAIAALKLRIASSGRYAADALSMQQPIRSRNNKLKFMTESWDMQRVRRCRHSFLQLSYILYDRIAMRIEIREWLVRCICIFVLFRCVSVWRHVRETMANWSRHTIFIWFDANNAARATAHLWQIAIWPTCLTISLLNTGNPNPSRNSASNSCRVTWLLNHSQRLLWTPVLHCVRCWFRIRCCGTDSLHHMQCIMHISWRRQRRTQRFF